MSESESLSRACLGCLLGAAVGDAFGLPMEGLSAARQERLFGKAEGYRFLFGRGMVSDDTEHAILTAQALIASGGEPELFAGELAKRLRRWFFTLPAGIGFATLRACLRLMIGMAPERSGVFSAGNGPAMRAALLGVVAGDNLERLRRLVRISARMTHTDPKAEFGAMAVAGAAWLQSRGEGAVEAFLVALPEFLAEENADELIRLLHKIPERIGEGWSVREFAQSLGCEKGVSGYIYHTVPVALYAVFRHGEDFQTAIREVVRCGGDTDTTAAITGGVLGVRCGSEGIPEAWLTGLWEPFDVSKMEALANQLATRKRLHPVDISLLRIYPRNLFFLTVVLWHGVRRLFPPY